MGQHDHLIRALPQKPPARFVDEVLEHDPPHSVTGCVRFDEGHRVFEGHLPGEPLVPGVILIEAMAQLCGLALVPGVGPGEAIHGYLGEVRGMRFRRRVGPGSRVIMTARLVQRFGKVYRFETAAELDGEPVADGEIIVVGEASPRE